MPRCCAARREHELAAAIGASPGVVAAMAGNTNGKIAEMNERNFLRVSEQYVVNMALVTHLELDKSVGWVVFHFGGRDSIQISGADAERFIFNMSVNIGVHEA
jgi:hypothetical protein